MTWMWYMDMELYFEVLPNGDAIVRKVPKNNLSRKEYVEAFKDNSEPITDFMELFENEELVTIRQNGELTCSWNYSRDINLPIPEEPGYYYMIIRLVTEKIYTEYGYEYDAYQEVLKIEKVTNFKDHEPAILVKYSEQHEPNKLQLVNIW